MRGELTVKQRIFLAQYFKDLNATAAARRAGYKSPNTQGPRLLVNVGIRREVEGRLKEHDLTADRVLEELATVVFSSMGHYLRFDENGDVYLALDGLTPRQQAAIAELRVDEAREMKRTHLRLHDKVAALDRLARHFRLYSDVDVNVSLEGLAERLAEARRRAGPAAPDPGRASTAGQAAQKMLDNE